MSNKQTTREAGFSECKPRSDAGLRLALSTLRVNPHVHSFVGPGRSYTGGGHTVGIFLAVATLNVGVLTPNVFMSMSSQSSMLKFY